MTHNNFTGNRLRIMVPTSKTTTIKPHPPKPNIYYSLPSLAGWAYHPAQGFVDRFPLAPILQNNPIISPIPNNDRVYCPTNGFAVRSPSTPLFHNSIVTSKRNNDSHLEAIPAGNRSAIITKHAAISYNSASDRALADKTVQIQPNVIASATDLMRCGIYSDIQAKGRPWPALGGGSNPQNLLIIKPLTANGPTEPYRHQVHQVIEKPKYPEGYKNPFDYSKYAVLNTPAEWANHAKPPPKEEDPFWWCLLCSKKEISKDSLLDHYQEHYDYHKKDKDKSKGQNLIPEYFECPVCYIELHLSNYERHIKKVHDEKEFFCDTCKTEYADAYTLSVHNATHSPDSDIFTCVICKEFTCKILPELLVHIILKHEKESQKCDVCEKVFTSQRRLNNHKVFHFNKTAYCVACKKQFSSVDNFLEHSKWVHFGKLHDGTKRECSTCKATFANDKALLKHQQSHDYSEKLCSVCGKTFGNQEKLKAHMVVHGDVKRFMCTVCGKSFFKSNFLTAHMRIHSGEKPYKCATCGKCFSQRSTLVIHQRLHTGERPYVCSTCNKGYVSKSALNTHARTCKGANLRRTKVLTKRKEKNRGSP